MKINIAIGLFGLAVLAGTTAPTATSQSAFECFASESKSVTTENRHCDNDCKRHADVQPIIQISMSMPEQWSSKGAFFRSPSITCSGGNGCSFADLGPASISNGGQVAQASFKTWSIPATITLQAEVCVLN